MSIFGKIKSTIVDDWPALVGIGLVILCVVSWFVHVFSCIAEGAWGFLIAGAIMFPIAIIHGFGLMIGVF